jgi:hypothetical protein
VFLVATIAGDLKNAFFTLILLALSYPAYLFVAKKKRLLAGTSDAITAPRE